MSKAASEGVLGYLNRPQLMQIIAAGLLAMFMANYYFERPGIQDAATQISRNWLPAIEYMGYILGYLAVVQRTQRTVQKRRKEWYIPLLTVATATAMILGYIFGGGFDNEVYTFLDINIRGLGMTTIFALNGLFTLSAALRALKFKSIYMSVAIISAALVFLWAVPIGGIIIPPITPIGQWMQDIVLAGGGRALTVATAVGTIILGFRILVGLEIEVFGFRKGKKR